MATTFTQTLNDQNRYADTTARAAIFQLLPSATVPCRGFVYGKKTPDANTVTLQPASGETISGASSLIISTVGNVTIKPIPGGWTIISQSAVTTAGGGSSGAALSLTFSGSVGLVGRAFNVPLVASGGTAPYTLSIGSGSLPTGLALTSGAVSGNPTAVGVFTFTGHVVDSVGATANTGTCTITISATAGPVADATLNSAAAIFTQDGGVEKWQLQTNSTPSSDPNVGNWQAIACPCCLLSTRGTGTGIPTHSGSAGNITVKVTPYGVPSVVNVSGANLTWVSGAKFNPALPVELAYCLIGTQSCQIASFTDTTHAVATFSPTAQGGSIAYIPQECRYGWMQDDSAAPGGIGNTVIIDQETFRLVSLSQFLDSDGNSTWTLARQGGSQPAHSGGAYVIAIQGAGVDQWAGSLWPGTTQSMSPKYDIGAPGAYYVYLVGVDIYGHQNTWPLTTTPHATLPLVAEVQLVSTLDPRRLQSTQLALGISGGDGKPITITTIGPSVLPNFDFEFGLKDWTIAGNATAQYTPPGPSGSYTGNACLLIQTYGSAESAHITCRPGDSMYVDTWIRGWGNPVPDLAINVNYYKADGTNLFASLGGNNIFHGTGSDPWTELRYVSTAPPNTSYVTVSIFPISTLAGGCGYNIDHVYFVPVTPAQALQLGSGLANDGSGNLISTNTSASLCNNYDFELGLADWITLGGSPSVGSTGGFAYTGSKYVSLGAVGAIRSTSKGCRANDAYLLDTYVRGVNTPSGCTVGAYVEYFDANNALCGYSRHSYQGPTSGDSGWQRITFTLSAPTAGTSSTGLAACTVAVAYDVQGTIGAGAYYVDHAMLTLLVNVSNGILVDTSGNLVFNGSSEFHFVGGQVQMQNIDLSKASNFSTQFAITSGQLGVSSLQIGGSGSPLSLCKFFTGATLYGFIGADTGGGGSGYTGAWFQRCGIGGPDPLHPAFFADSFGNVAISGSLISGGTIASSAFVAAGSSFTLNMDSTTGLKITATSTSNYVTLDSVGITLATPLGGSHVVVGSYTECATFLSGSWSMSSNAGSSTGSINLSAVPQGSSPNETLNVNLGLYCNGNGTYFVWDGYSGLMVKWGGTAGVGKTLTFKDQAGVTHQVVGGIITS